MQDVNPILTSLRKSVKLTVPIKSTNAPQLTHLMQNYQLLNVCSTWNSTQSSLHLSQFTMSYGLEHWTAVKHVLRYLKGTQDDRLTFRQETGLGLVLFVDGDYVNWADTLSIGSYVGMLGSGSIAWSSKK